jgi:hypothetical protein
MAVENQKVIPKNPKLYILNTLVIPIDFDKIPKAIILVEKISLNEARELILRHKDNMVSAIGHQATAILLSKLLQYNIPYNRINVYFNTGDIGLHFFLKTRIEEGKILNLQELEKLDYWFVKSIVY